MSDKSKMPLDELQATSEYLKLTQKQQLFVSTYVAGGLADGHYDAVQAVRTAYNCKTLEVARIMSYAIMGNIRIIAVLNRHFQATPTEELLVAIDRAINNKKLTMAQLYALKLKCDVLGLANRIPNHQSPGIIPQDVLEESKKKPKTPPGVKEPKPDKFGKVNF
jgi:hypothetical protein